MMKNIFFYFYLICIACNQNKNNGQNFQVIHTDSIANALKNNAVSVNELQSIQNLIDQNSIDTLSIAKLELALYNQNKTTEKKLFHIVELEKAIKKTTVGKEILATCYYHLASNNKEIYDYTKKIEYCEKYQLYANSKLDSLYKISILSNLGESYLRLGDKKKCKASLQAALYLAKATGNNKEQAYCLSALFNMYARYNEIQSAKKCIVQALQIPLQSKSDIDFMTMQKYNVEETSKEKINGVNKLLKATKVNSVKFYCNNILGDIYYEKNDKQVAIEYYLQAALTLGQEPRMIAKRYQAIGEIFLEKNEIDSANVYLDKGMNYVAKTTQKNGFIFPTFEKLIAENTIFDIAVQKAKLQKIDPKGNIYNEIQYLLAAKKVAELLRKSLVFNESKYEWGIDLKTVSEQLLACYYQLYKSTKDKKYAKMAFMIVDENKANSLQDETEQNILANQNNDTNYAKYIELRKQLNDIEIQIENASTQAQKEKLEITSNNITAQLGVYKSLSNTSSNKQQDEYTFEKVNEYLASNSYNVISYFIGDKNLYILAMQPGKNEIYFKQCDTLIKDSIQTLCTMQCDENIYSTQKNRFIHLSNYVYRAIFENIIIDDKQNKLIILPDAVLNNLAFDALLTDSTKLNSFLIKNQTISYAYSIRSLISQQQRDFCNNHNLLAIAPFTNNAIRNLPKLQSSLAEINNMKEQFTSQIFTNNTATFFNFQRQLLGNQYIHIASHATAGETPCLQFYDSAVFVNSIYQIPMNQSLAYLNTCQSGSGINYYSEGNLSLGRAFYSNGVHNIVLTLWNMNDASTATISNLFYTNIHESNNSITALHKAKLKYLESQPIDKQAPYYWASLQHIGDGDLGDDGLSDWWKWACGACLIVIGAWWCASKRG
jgi:CHAT domain-containing protein